MPFPPLFFSLFCTFLIITCPALTLTLRPPLGISLTLFFLGIALYIKHVLNRIVYVLPTYRLPAWRLSCLVTLLPLCLPHLVPFLAFACSRGGQRCFVLSCFCLVLPCLVAFGFIVCCLSFSFLVYFFSFVSLVSYSSTSKCRASLSHTCTTTKFDHSIYNRQGSHFLRQVCSEICLSSYSVIFATLSTVVLLTKLNGFGV